MFGQAYYLPREQRLVMGLDCIEVLEGGGAFGVDGLDILLSQFVTTARTSVHT